MEMQSNAIKYNMCGDLSAVEMVTGVYLQTGYLKFGCFLCLWGSGVTVDIRPKVTGPLKLTLVPGTNSIHSVPLVETPQSVSSTSPQ